MSEQFRIQRPNAVVLEKSSHDDADINAQRIAAVRHFSSLMGRDVQEEHETKNESDDSDSNVITDVNFQLQKKSKKRFIIRLSIISKRKMLKPQVKKR